MIPGVTNLPVPSTTIALSGASTLWPTATMCPSRSRIEPPTISVPVAVRIVALRISTGREGRRWYVDGYCARKADMALVSGRVVSCVLAARAVVAVVPAVVGAAPVGLVWAPDDAQPAATTASATHSRLLTVH